MHFNLRKFCTVSLSRRKARQKRGRYGMHTANVGKCRKCAVVQKSKRGRSKKHCGKHDNRNLLLQRSTFRKRRERQCCERWLPDEMHDGPCDAYKRRRGICEGDRTTMAVQERCTLPAAHLQRSCLPGCNRREHLASSTTGVVAAYCFSSGCLHLKRPVRLQGSDGRTLHSILLHGAASL